MVVDNFEHVLDASPAIAEMIVAAPALKVVAISRSLGADLWDIADAGADASPIKSDKGSSMTDAVRLLIQVELEPDCPTSCRMRYDGPIAGC